MLYQQHHSNSEKRFLGAVVPAGTGGAQSLNVSLDTLFNHPNVGPCQLMQACRRDTLEQVKCDVAPIEGVGKAGRANVACWEL